MSSFLLDDWIVDFGRSGFAPEHPSPEMRYAGLRCSCGGQIFRLHGWPSSVVGRGGYFWRTLLRVWREARLPTTGDEPGQSPFVLPVILDCERCGRTAPLFDEPGLPGRLESSDRSQPRESYRCRVCRRGRIALVVGRTGGLADGADGEDAEDAEDAENAENGEWGGDAESGEDAATRMGKVGVRGRAFELVARCQACHRQARVVGSDARASLREARLDLLYGRR